MLSELYRTGFGSLTISTIQIGVRTNFGDGYKTNQRWHIEQTTAQQGFLEVKIWTKVSSVFYLYIYICNLL